MCSVVTDELRQAQYFIFCFLIFIYFTSLEEQDDRLCLLRAVINAGGIWTCIHSHVIHLPYHRATDAKYSMLGISNKANEIYLGYKTPRKECLWDN